MSTPSPPFSPLKGDRSKTGLYFTSESTLKYLNGSLPGDYGFDPLGLMDPVNSGGFINPKWLAYAEVQQQQQRQRGMPGPGREMLPAHTQPQVEGSHHCGGTISSICLCSCVGWESDNDELVGPR